MSDLAIRVEGLGKKYRLGTSNARYKTMRESLMSMTSLPARSLARLTSRKNMAAAPNRSEFWALKDVSFEVKHGEVLGIIGRNGAGKSTLLKLLSQITEPTEGAIGVNGRMASLLEVGTGFHPELTGRENVFLNGAILGMSRVDILRKFDEIVAFAEVEKFVDTPVKHYSSGMYLRLAFAVAAHLEPEILIVDEVLAVGDAEFQKKCLGKMEDVAHQGRTVIFVSHNMGAISTLCGRAIVLDHGSVAYRGLVEGALSYYIHQASSQLGLSKDLRQWENRIGTGEARIVWGSVSWKSRSDGVDFVAIGDDLIVNFDVECAGEIRRPEFACVVTTMTGIPVLHMTSADDVASFTLRECTRITVHIPNMTLFPGTYTVSVWVGNQYGGSYDWVKDCFKIDVVKGNRIRRTLDMNWHHGLVYHQSYWTSSESSAHEPLVLNHELMHSNSTGSSSSA